MSNKIEIYRGDSRTITVTVTDSAGAVFDLTGYTMTMTVKENLCDSSSAAVITKDATISSPATGVGTIALTSVQTTVAAKEYQYSVVITDTSTPPNVYTVISPSTLTILQR